MKRIVGIDYGKVRIGLAVSDPSQIIASPLKAVIAKPSLKETATLLLQEISMYEPVEKIVLGLPLMMNGKESPSSKEVRELAKFLEGMTDKTIVLWDERLTTAQVERTLKEAKMRRKKRTQYIDAMAAAAILQNFLDSPSNK
ncbi:MAG: putative pre-16S rRNA nuclease [Chlamydiae bacterium]|nr:putative pre-16S rRNA nuclease [Chlamydiota bacterium]